MIKIKANATMRGENAGTEITIEMRGEGMQIANEALSIIQGLMGDIKGNSRVLHAMCLEAIADNPEILLANKDDEEEDAEEMLHGAVGIKMSRATDKSVID